MTRTIQEAGDEILGHAVRLTVAKRDEHHFVASQDLPVPTAMLTNKGTALVFLRQSGSGIEHKSQRCHVGAQRVIRLNGRCNEIRPLRLCAYINVLAVIAVGPAIERAILH